MDAGTKFNTMLGRALLDTKFRDQLTGSRAQQEQALKDMDIAPTEDNLRALQESVAALTRLAQSVDGIGRAAT